MCVEDEFRTMNIYQNNQSQNNKYVLICIFFCYALAYAGLLTFTKSVQAVSCDGVFVYVIYFVIDLDITYIYAFILICFILWFWSSVSWQKCARRQSARLESASPFMRVRRRPSDCSRCRPIVVCVPVRRRSWPPPSPDDVWPPACRRIPGQGQSLRCAWNCRWCMHEMLKTWRVNNVWQLDIPLIIAMCIAVSGRHIDIYCIIDKQTSFAMDYGRFHRHDVW